MTTSRRRKNYDCPIFRSANIDDIIEDGMLIACILGLQMDLKLNVGLFCVLPLIMFDSPTILWY